MQQQREQEMTREDPYRQAIAGMTRAVYDRMVTALAEGRWADGRPLTEVQRQHTMAAVIAWGELNLPSEERVGYIDKGSKAGSTCDDPAPLRWAGDSDPRGDGE